jgi:hypothetical protein
MSAPLSVETAFHPTRALRRGWFVLTESPVLLWVLAVGVVLAERFAEGVWDRCGQALVGRLEGAMPGVGSQRWAAWEPKPLEGEFLLWVGPVLILLLAIRCGFDLRAFRAHQSLLQSGAREKGGEEHTETGWFELFQFRLIAWGLVLGGLVLAMLPGILVFGWAVRAVAPVLGLFGLFLMLLFGLPVWVYLSLGVYTGDRLMVYANLGPVQALEASWDLARGNRFSLLIFRLVSVVYKLAGIGFGLLLCGVGVLVTWPLAKAVSEAALSEAILVLREGEVSPPSWKMLLTHEQAP